MKSVMRNLARAMLVVAVAVGCGLAQDGAAEKHVQNIKAEFRQDAVAASALCGHVKETAQAYTHLRQVDPATLERSLTALMKKSDEVVVASAFLDHTDTISASGEDAIQYFDVRVLYSWKGNHKAGDLLTFAVPSGTVTCEPDPNQRGLFLGAATMTGGVDWKGIGSRGPYVLFLRQSRGDEAGLISGLRLTGGGGAQGMFAFPTESGEKPDASCAGAIADGAGKCVAFLESSQSPVSIAYRSDPLVKKYDGMPFSAFMKEVERVVTKLQ